MRINSASGKLKTTIYIRINKAKTIQRKDGLTYPESFGNEIFKTLQQYEGKGLGRI